MPTCKACLGKKQHSVVYRKIWLPNSHNEIGFYADRNEMRDCIRCKGTGEELNDSTKFEESNIYKAWINNIPELGDGYGGPLFPMPKKHRSYTYLLLLVLFVVLVCLISSVTTDS